VKFMWHELKDAKLINGIIERIGQYKLNLTFMHACGTHQETLSRYGLGSLLSKVGIRIRSGPGCPVCVTTAKEFLQAMKLAEKGKIITIYGDCFRVPVNRRSLMHLKTEGYDVRIVYSIDESVELARTVEKDVVFMAIGFETTAPSTASTLVRDDLPENFYVLSCHRFFPPAMIKLLELGEVKLDGIIEPGHVSAIIGCKPYEVIMKRFKIPQVISGFEPLDIILSVYYLVRQIVDGEAKVVNEYNRVVSREGNQTALSLIDRVFYPKDIEWRGFPVVPSSLMTIRDKYSKHDAHKQFEDIISKVQYEPSPLEKGCRCGEVLRGVIQPTDCPLFGKVCNLENPVGACMVSVEGACRIFLEYPELN